MFKPVIAFWKAQMANVESKGKSRPTYNGGGMERRKEVLEAKRASWWEKVNTHPTCVSWSVTQITHADSLNPRPNSQHFLPNISPYKRWRLLDSHLIPFSPP
jgi:hypothetical protein